MHEHLQVTGLSETAAMLLKEAQLTPLQSVIAPSSLAHQVSTQENTSIQLQWPSGRSPSGFLSSKLRAGVREEELRFKCEAVPKKRPLIFSPSFGSQLRHQVQSHDSQSTSFKRASSAPRQSQPLANISESLPEAVPRNYLDADAQCKTPIMLPMKRKLSDLKDTGLSLSWKRLSSGDHGLRSPVCPTPVSGRRSCLHSDVAGFSTPVITPRDQHCRSTPGILADCPDDSPIFHSHIGQVTPSLQAGLLSDSQPSNLERLTLDSIVVQYLKHQHRQCPAPITTLPPLSLLHPHVCPEPKRSLDAPSNITARLGTREFKNMCGGVHGNRRDRQFVYSRFRPWRTCRDDAGTLSTCITFLGDSSHIAVGSHAGELKIFDSDSNSVLESCTNHQSPLTLVQSYISDDAQLILSSSSQDVRLWDATSITGGPLHSFDGCKAARFSTSGNIFAALSAEVLQREILLYDVQTGHLESKLTDASTNSVARGHIYSQIHFSLSDTMLLWNGVLWDRRVPGPVHQFDQFTDYGGGGFHPAGNEVYLQLLAALLVIRSNF